MKFHHSGHALPARDGAECDDAWAVRERRGTVVAALADGVSASREGGAAARRAVEMLADFCLARPRAWSPRRALIEFTAQANRHLHSEALARLASPDLVRAWTPPGAELHCYAMEFCDAPTLRAVLRFGRLGVEEARELAQFFVRVGQFLVRHDLVHGDLKPDNVLVLRGAAGTSFRLLDLGSAAELFSVTSRAGTASYLAPERFRGGALSECTEIFAIGVTLYEALTGAYPYGEIERFQTPRFDTVPRRVTRLNSAVPAWFEAVILRAVDPEPERRYQNFSELAFDLANPARVAPHHRKDAPLLERNPLRFYKILCLVLFGLNLWLIARLLRH